MSKTKLDSSDCSLSDIKRVCPGLYRLGDTEIDQRWHPELHQAMWHIVVDGESVEFHGYLKDAKASAVEKANGKEIRHG